MTKTGTKGKKKYIQRYQYNISGFNSIKQLKKYIGECPKYQKYLFRQEEEALYLT